MEQAREQQEQPPTKLKCPRCGSLDTKFRYFNNHSLAQPRHCCKTCKRLWTVGGHTRNIPVGGKTRNAKPTTASSSRGGSPGSQLPEPPLLPGEEHQHHPHSPTLTTIVSQSLDGGAFQPVRDMPSAESQLESYYFNDEISCLDAIQSLIQPGICDQHVDVGGRFSSGANATTTRERNVQTAASQRATEQRIPRNMESRHTHNEAVIAPLSRLYSNNVVQAAWPINSSARDVTNDFGFTASNAHLWNNSGGDGNNTEDANSVNVDEWLNFPDNDPL